MIIVKKEKKFVKNYKKRITAYFREYTDNYFIE